jgi:hypothetical protein
VQLFTTFYAKLSGNPMNKLVMKNLRQEEEECRKLKIREWGETSGQGSVYAFL